MDWQSFGGNWTQAKSRLRNRFARVTREDIATPAEAPPQLDPNVRPTDGRMPAASAEDVETGNSPPLLST